MRRLQGLAALIDDEIGHRLGFIQFERTIELALCKLGLGARIRKLAFGLLGDRLKGAGIDDVEQIAGVDERAVTKLDIGDETADPGTYLHLFHRIESAGEFIPIGDGPFGWLSDRDRRRRGCRRLRRFIAAAGQGDGEQDDQRSGAAEATASGYRLNQMP